MKFMVPVGGGAPLPDRVAETLTVNSSEPSLPAPKHCVSIVPVAEVVVGVSGLGSAGYAVVLVSPARANLLMKALLTGVVAALLAAPDAFVAEG
jgi:hypothetical protein